VEKATDLANARNKLCDKMVRKRKVLDDLNCELDGMIRQIDATAKRVIVGKDSTAQWVNLEFGVFFFSRQPILLRTMRLGHSSVRLKGHIQVPLVAWLFIPGKGWVITVPHGCFLPSSPLILNTDCFDDVTALIKFV